MFNQLLTSEALRDAAQNEKVARLLFVKRLEELWAGLEEAATQHPAPSPVSSALWLAAGKVEEALVLLDE